MLDFVDFTGHVPIRVEVPLSDLLNLSPTATADAPVGLEGSTVFGQVTATDPNGEAVTFLKGTDPSNGSVTVAQNGTYDYIPDAGFFGTDDFEVIADDGNGGTDSVTATVTVEPFDVILDTDATFNTQVAGFAALADALTAAVDGQAIEIVDAASVGDAGALIVKAEDLTIRGNALFDAVFLWLDPKT